MNLIANLKTIKQDALKVPAAEIANHAAGILSTENQEGSPSSDVVEPMILKMLYKLVGTCANRWYD
nr:9363_t:CDS:2 [Entrophospora candida]